MTAELTYPDGLIYIGICIVMVIIIAVLAARVKALKDENEYLLSRRPTGRMAEAAGEEAEAPKPPAICEVFCNHRDIVIPAQQAEIASLKVDLKNAEIRCEIMQSTIAKLRTGRGSEDV